MSNSYITGQDLVAAIRRAFERASMYTRGNERAITFDDLLESLVLYGIVGRGDRHDSRARPIRDLHRLSNAPMGRVVWALQCRFGTLGDLASADYATVMGTPGVGAVGMAKIEAALAQAGLMLADRGEVERLENDDPEPVEPEAAVESNADCARAFLGLAERMWQDGMILARIGVQAETNPKNAATQVRHWLGNARRSHREVVARIAVPLFRSQENPAGPGAGDRRACRELALNVIPVAFKER